MHTYEPENLGLQIIIARVYSCLYPGAEDIEAQVCMALTLKYIDGISSGQRITTKSGSNKEETLKTQNSCVTEEGFSVNTLNYLRVRRNKFSCAED